MTTPRGNTTSYSFDALNRLTSVPVASGVTIVTSYGYDTAGNLTRSTDGRGNATWQTYQSWNLTDVDPEGAYSLQYDAARKAVAAIMLSEGLRARAMLGSHRAVAEFARRIDATSPARNHLRRFDAMRRNRNRIEYGATTIGSQVVADDLQHAREIVVIARRRVDRTSA